MVLQTHVLLGGQNTARKNSTPENSGLYSPRSGARYPAPRTPVAVSTISRSTDTACAIQSSMCKACVLPPAWWKPDARSPSVRVSNALECTGPFTALTPSSPSAVPSSADAFRTFGNAERNKGPHDSSLSCRAPVRMGGWPLRVSLFLGRSRIRDRRGLPYLKPPSLSGANRVLCLLHAPLSHLVTSQVFP